MYVCTGMVYFQIILNLITGFTTDHTQPDKVVSLMTEIRGLQDVIAKFKAIQVDPTEYACLKGIVLFKSGKIQPYQTDKCSEMLIMHVQSCTVLLSFGSMLHRG